MCSCFRAQESTVPRIKQYFNHDQGLLEIGRSTPAKYNFDLWFATRTANNQRGACATMITQGIIVRIRWVELLEYEQAVLVFQMFVVILFEGRDI